MSQTTKIVLGVAVVAVVLAGAYFYWQQHEAVQPETNSEVTSLPSGSNTSDTSLNEDLTAIDSQLQAAASDTADANGSVNAAAAAQ